MDLVLGFFVKSVLHSSITAGNIPSRDIQ